MNCIRRPLAASCLAISAAAMFTASIPGAFAAEPRPLRVLFFDPAGAEQGKAGVLRVAMEQLGRDAIYFDYFTPASGLSEKMAALYDVAMVLGGGDAPALSALKAKQRVVTVKDNEAPAAIRSTILATVDPAAKSDWEKFLAQREPEMREQNPNVANYEKRPEAITFQHPFSVKGTMERTQVPADLRAGALRERAGHREAHRIRVGRARAAVGRGDERLSARRQPRTARGTTTSRFARTPNGDGKADKFTVFADKLNIPTGIVFARGGVIVAQPPRFLFLKDTNGDDKADVREVHHRRLGHPRHARAGEQPALRLRQLALRLRRLLGLRGHGRREAVRLRDGHLSLQAGRLGARVPASVHEQRVGAQRE